MHHSRDQSRSASTVAVTQVANTVPRYSSKSGSLVECRRADASSATASRATAVAR